MAQTSPSRKLEKIMVRSHDGMRQGLARLAAINRRSVNAQIIVMLEAALPGAEAAAGAKFGDYTPAAAENTAAESAATSATATERKRRERPA